MSKRGPEAFETSIRPRGNQQYWVAPMPHHPRPRLASCNLWTGMLMSWYMTGSWSSSSFWHPLVMGRLLWLTYTQHTCVRSHVPAQPALSLCALSSPVEVCMSTQNKVASVMFMHINVRVLTDSSEGTGLELLSFSHAFHTVRAWFSRHLKSMGAFNCLHWVRPFSYKAVAYVETGCSCVRYQNIRKW